MARMPKTLTLNPPLRRVSHEASVRPSSFHRDQAARKPEALEIKIASAFQRAFGAQLLDHRMRAETTACLKGVNNTDTL